MKLLFIKLKHIGDALLLTPTLEAARRRHPDAEISVWLRSGTEGILSGCTALDRLLVTSPPGASSGWASRIATDFSTLSMLRQEGIDLVFDLSEGPRGRWLSLATGARFIACASTDAIPKPWPALFDVCKPYHACGDHRVLHDYLLAKELLDLPEEAPPLQFARERANFDLVRQNGLEGAVVLHPATRWKRKMWPVAHWAALCRHLDALGCRLVLSSGPVEDEVRACREIQASSGVPMLLTEGRLDWAAMAGLLMSARLFIGVDTAAMHLAAACQTPLVALFGPTVESAWRPWKCDHVLVTPRMSDAEITRPDGHVDLRLRKIDRIEVTDVLHACQQMLAGGRT
ncbi:MAG: glycosyltransferase family 9 protein [Verrucomicrobiaceae bacterium]|nr:glycosyltransferase family 9 protein [Verrucomicrobiaceae bacterium]